ncbi:alpha/beta hydrolase fold protein [Oleiphilus messinensis]|uniref:Alpha/beta hydrolase fold protein n=2 Tax=Oleiphilus messinensis TaxID=141451 RepID=A0A1Y0IBV2_9GAMM|nr:alpha/beta hydrolase fold protein [Oleiphilus messinensis]
MKSIKRLSLFGSGIIALICLVFAIAHATRDHEALTLDQSQRENIGGDYISIPQGVVHYEFSANGTGPVIVLVHGFSVPSYVWEPTFNTLKANGFRVLRFDLFGRGFSDRPDLEYVMDDYVAQLHALLQALKIEKTVQLVGLSMGGAVVTHFTNRYPEKVERLSLIAPLIRTPDRPELLPLMVPVLGDWLADVLMVPTLRKGVSKAVYDPSTFPDWERRLNPQTQYAGYTHAILNTARQLRGQDFSAQYFTMLDLQKPVQLIWGENDQTLPYSDHTVITDYASKPGQRAKIDFRPIPKSGHLPHWEHPELVGRALIEFLRPEE